MNDDIASSELFLILKGIFLNYPRTASEEIKKILSEQCELLNYRKTTSEGDCLFDSISWAIGMDDADFSSKEQRPYREYYAQHVRNLIMLYLNSYFNNIATNDFSDLVGRERGEQSSDETYLEIIKTWCTLQSFDRPSEDGNDAALVERNNNGCLTDLDSKTDIQILEHYLNTLIQKDAWGSHAIEGRIACNLFGINIVINDVTASDQGSRSKVNFYTPNNTFTDNNYPTIFLHYNGSHYRPYIMNMSRKEVHFNAFNNNFNAVREKFDFLLSQGLPFKFTMKN